MLSKILTHIQSIGWLILSGVQWWFEFYWLSSPVNIWSVIELHSRGFDETVFNEASVADATIQEATNNPIIDDAALGHDYKKFISFPSYLIHLLSNRFIFFYLRSNMFQLSV